MVTNEDRIRFTLRMTRELYGKLKEKADTKGFTLNALLTEILWTHVEEGTERG